MNRLNIDLNERSYPIYITTDYSELVCSLSNARIASKVVVITDTNVERCQLDACVEALSEFKGEIYKYVIQAGEKSKNLDTIRDIYQFLVELKLDRKSTLIALGGGVVGDITGFVAATFLRGINFVQVPTSLLAQSDSSVGGKVGVDFLDSKNIIGAFYQPRLVYINVTSLKTLPKRELQAGLAEVVKHGIIYDAEFFDYIDCNVNEIFEYDEDVLQYIAKINCSIKGDVVQKDEKESGLRAILNFGHTIGHAIESVKNFELLHGECVSIGMVAAFRLAQYLEMVESDLVDKVCSTLKKIGLPLTVSGIDVESVYKQMFYDKKIKDNKLTFILPRRELGKVIECVIDDEMLIKKAISDVVI